MAGARQRPDLPAGDSEIAEDGYGFFRWYVRDFSAARAAATAASAGLDVVNQRTLESEPPQPLHAAVRDRGDNQQVTLGHGVVGVSMAAGNAEALWQRADKIGLSYPLLARPGPRAVEVFIASERVSRLLRPESDFVALVLRNTRIPLPPSEIGPNRLQWTVPPGWHVPELDPLMDLIHSAEPRRYQRTR